MNFRKSKRLTLSHPLCVCHVTSMFVTGGQLQEWQQLKHPLCSPSVGNPLRCEATKVSFILIERELPPWVLTFCREMAGLFSGFAVGGFDRRESVFMLYSFTCFAYSFCCLNFCIFQRNKSDNDWLVLPGFCSLFKASLALSLSHTGRESSEMVKLMFLPETASPGVAGGGWG